MNKDEALKSALEALELVNIEFVCNGAHHAKKDRHELGDECPVTNRYRQSITAIKEALEQPEQEPVADVLIDHEDEDGHAVIWLRDYALENGRHLLYTTPPQRKEPEQEPVAWMVWGEDNVPSFTFKKPSDKYVFDSLYITPPQRAWVGLTDEEAIQMHIDCSCISELFDAIDAKLKYKNTRGQE